MITLKIEIDAPNIPPNSKPEDAIKILADWSRDVTEKINMMLGSIDEDNLSASLRERI